MFEPQPCCKAGHEYTPDNTWLDKVGHRRCRICARAAETRGKAKRDELLRLAQDMRTGQVVPVPARSANHNIWDMYHPQCPEPEKPIPPLVLFGPFGGPGAALGER